ncbi:hypothetical protein IAE30_20845 [Pantoea sp. S61]|uniref:hypothetical protein n=1 Tax=Pantoea sp. S61 TaxID=2767442 RepID=UPI00190C2D70|nr:hypothetical protein [Pantoea sp. S61]MBK0126191.1 hypothetical protein [Pantoea sp. S61]
MTKTDYKARFNTILLESSDPYEIFSLCDDMVSAHGRQGGVLAYTLMNEVYKSGLTGNAKEAALDVLEALTGYCADPIGTADYHLTNHAA